MSKKKSKGIVYKELDLLKDNQELLAAYFGSIFALLYVYKLVKKQS